MPAGFDPCKDNPKSVLDSEGLHKASSNNNADYDGAGGTKWRGCSWVMSNGYTAGITTTNLTVDKVATRPPRRVRTPERVKVRPATTPDLTAGFTGWIDRTHRRLREAEPAEW